MIGIVVLAQRELIRFLRQPTRLLGSLLQPLLFWLFMGAGFAGSFRTDHGASEYGEFFFPGIVLLLLLFAAIFSTITLIEDRTAGFLQGVLVAPVSRSSLVLGKLIGGTGIALLQALIFVGLAPLAGIGLSPGIFVQLVLLFILVGLGFTGMGFVVAWSFDSVAGYHSVMSVVMIPLWLLSGALFPLESAAGWLRWVMSCNPVTYNLVVIRGAFYQDFSVLLGDSSYLLALAVTLLWVCLTVAGSVAIASRRSRV